MFQKFMNPINNKKKNDKGAAIIMVIVAIAFIGMLVTMVLYMSYYNYLMKATDKATKNNFYSAETALELVNAGLQKDINDCVSKAYVMTSQLSADKSEAELSELFQNFFKIEMGTLLVGGKAKYNPAATKLYWDRNHVKSMLDVDDSMTYASAEGNQGVWLDGYNVANTTNPDKFLLIRNQGEFILQDLKLTYMDDHGYVSMIKTDVIVQVPSYDFALNTTGLSLENYSIIANDSFVNDRTPEAYLTEKAIPESSYAGMSFGRSDTTVTGNVFGGNEGVYVKDNAGLSFVDDTTDTISNYDFVAGSVNVQNTKGGNGFKVDNKHNNFLYDIQLEKAATFDMAGNSFVRDDLDIFGKDVSVKLSGDYKGFGSDTVDANNSSSIMINGADATIDFSGLNSLQLAGNAFVGATHYDADVSRYKYGYNITKPDNQVTSDYIKDIEKYDETLAADPAFVPNDDTVSRNSADVMMGQSIAVKTEQLAYMVPTDCIGFKRGETKKQVLGKNPLTYEEYMMLTTTYKAGTTDKDPENLEYDLYDLSALNTRMETEYSVQVKPVFRRVNGNVLVYLYLDFNGNQEEASRFFQDYVELNEDSFKKYVKSYVKSLTWSNKLTQDNRKNLAIAGNAFTIASNGDVVIEKENLTTDADKRMDIQNNGPVYAQQTEAMMHMLTSNYNDVNGTQLMNSVYDNIVDVASVSDDTKLGNKEFIYDSKKVKTVIGDYKYTSADSDVKVIVATGNVFLADNFDGLVVAGKSIFVGFDCEKITYNAIEVYSLLTSAVSADGKKAYEIFGELGKMSYGLSEISTEEGKAIDTAQYVMYKDWQKE